MGEENLGGEEKLGWRRRTSRWRKNLVGGELRRREYNLGGEGELQGGGRERENGRMLEENLSTALLSGR